MSELRHITRINDLWANVLTDLDDHQTAILTDQDNEYIWRHGANFFHGTPSKHWTGAAFVYHDVDFKDVTARGDLFTAEFVYHFGDTDTRRRYQDDQITDTAGGIDFVNMLEDATQDKFTVNPNSADIDTIINAVGMTNAVFHEGSTGFTGLGGITDPDTLLHVWGGTAGVVAAPANTLVTFEDNAEFYLSLLVSTAGTRCGIYMGDDNDNDNCRISATPGSSNMYLAVGSVTEANSQLILQTAKVIINNASQNVDFEVKGQAATLMFGDASLSRFGIHTNNPQTDIDLNGAVTINEDGVDKDTRVETLDYTYMIFAEGGTNRVGFNEATPDTLVHMRNLSTVALPVLKIEQLAVAEPLLDYVGTSAADQTKSISTVNGDGVVTGPKDFSTTAGWVFIGMVRKAVSGTDRWFPFYAAETE